MVRFLLLTIGCTLASVAFAQISPVQNVTAGTDHETIAGAINSATPGDHIQLAPVTFVEHVAIGIPLTISGDASGGTILDVSAADGWGVTLSADHITIEDFTIIGGGDNTAYAVHSEPGISGLTIDNVDVFESTRSCIDLNGLTGPYINVIRDVTVSGSVIGFGLALSTCADVLIENVSSVNNAFGDVAIMESNYYDQEVTGITFMGDLDLRGPQSLGGGGIVVQIDPTDIPVGIGPGYPINVSADGFEQLIEAPGDLTGCILVHEDDIRGVANTLGGAITDLIATDMLTQHSLVYPGMRIQPALDNAEDGDVIEVDAGVFDTIPLVVSSDVTILGSNAGTPAEGGTPRTAETLIPGIVLNGGNVTLDGLRIQGGTGTAIDVTSISASLTLRNSLLIGSDHPGSQGVKSMGTVTLEDTRISRFASAIVQESGELTVSGVRLHANDKGVALNGSTPLQTHLTDVVLENPGGIGLHVVAAPQESEIHVLNSSFDLHGTSIKMDAPVSLSSTGAVYTNAEQQTEGVSEAAKLALCEVNTFLPALRIAGCMDAEADNYAECATIDFGCEYLGCTSPKACNFDSGANVDDGSCDFVTCAGCPLGFACNYDPDADLYRVESCDFTECGEGMAESGMDRQGLSLVDGCTIPQACNFNPNATTEDGSCAFDCYGCLDAEACNFDATFTQASNETCLYKADLYTSVYVDCDGVCFNDANGNGVCDEEEVSGCMDFEACNFQALATLDDGQCDFQSCAGCTNAQACNYDEEAWITDGSCDYDSCKGCTDPNACNHDLGATLDDGTCAYPVDLYNKTYVDCDGQCLNDANGNDVCDEVEVLGCMDQGACVFDPDATMDDGSCDYASCAGCMDETACNFSPGATIESGQCSHPEDLYPGQVVDGQPVVDCLGRCLNDADLDGICDEFEVVCPGDLNGDGLRGASDILVLLGSFGCMGECGVADLNEDGLVSADDILVALSTFGLPCTP